MIDIAQRCIQALELICRHSGPVTARSLAAAMNVSERTARYDLSLLSSWLLERGVELKSAPKKGFYLEERQRERALALLRDFGESSGDAGRFLSADERVRMIVTDVLEERSSWSFDEAAEHFGVSRTTFARDLRQAEKWFAAHGARLLRRQKRGVRLEGDEGEYRRLIVAFIQENSDQKALLTYFITCGRTAERRIPKPSSFAYINRILCGADLPVIIDTVERYNKEKGAALFDEDLIALIYYLAVMVTRVRDGHGLSAISPQYQPYAETAECGEIEAILASCLSRMLSPDQLRCEAAYLSARWLAIAEGPDSHASTANSKMARRISAYLFSRLQEELGLDLRETDDLFNAMKTHLQAAITRMRLSIPSPNPLLEETRRRFPEVFRLCSQITEEIGARFGVFLHEHEVGFLTMYTAGAIRRERNHPPVEHIRAVLICGYGVGTVSLLMSALKQQFPHIAIVDRLSIFDLAGYDFSQVDLIFSTIDIPLPLSKPLLKVNPLLSRLDLRRIYAFLHSRQGMAASTTPEFRVGELLSVISKHCDIRDADQLARELKRAVSPYSGPPRALTELPSLLDVLPRRHILAHIEAASWDEAVWKAAQPLLDDGHTTREYVEEIIEIKEQYGQYSVLCGGVCMPHASPSIFYKLSLSLATLKEPLELVLDGQPVKIYVVMVLSLADTITQAKILDEIFSLLDEFPHIGAELQGAATTEELCRLFKKYYDRLF